MPDKCSTDAYKDQASLPKLVANSADLEGFQAFKGDHWVKTKARADKKLSDAGATISPEEVAAIEGYTSQDYQFLNPVLRNGGSANVDSLTKGKKYTPADILPYINCVVSGLNKLPAAAEKTVYRGTNLPASVLARYAEGAVVGDTAFMSTTTDSKVAFKPMSGKASLHRFTINHRSGRDVTALTLHPGEKEILFLPGTRFRVSKRGAPGKDRVIHMTLDEI